MKKENPRRTEAKVVGWLFIIYAILFGLFFLIFGFGCAVVKVSDEPPAKMISWERIGRSPDYWVCVQRSNGQRKTVLYQSHCFRCEPDVPKLWKVGIDKKGNLYFDFIR